MESEKLAVRLGGIYALEQIALDSEELHWPVIEVLTAFVRENSRTGPSPECAARDDIGHEVPPAPGPGSDKAWLHPATDLQAILTVVSRRPGHRVRYEHQNGHLLDLSDVWLPGGRFQYSLVALRSLSDSLLHRSRSVFPPRGSWVHGAHLEGGHFRFAHLEGADFRFANLERADFGGAQLAGADLHGANLQGANLQGANLSGADLRGAKLQGADLKDANLSGTDLQRTGLTGEQLKEAVCNEHTLLPPSESRSVDRHR